MALLRQNGSPSLFLTLSCAEFDWPELLREIAETIYKRKFTAEEIEGLSNQERNKLISENVVQSTVHFQKRIEKMFTLMGYDFFGDKNQVYVYSASSYFYRVEFQQRGAPHVHSLLWLRDKKNKEAPNFWVDSQSSNKDEPDENQTNQARINTQINMKNQDISRFADQLISTSPNDISCEKHEKLRNQKNCEECKMLKDKVENTRSTLIHLHVPKRGKL